MTYILNKFHICPNTNFQHWENRCIAAEQCAHAIAWVNILLCIVLIPITNCNDMWTWYLVQFPFLTCASSLHQINFMCVIPPTSAPWIMWCIYLIGMLLCAQSRRPVILCLRLISYEDIQGICTPFFTWIQLLYTLIATTIKVSI